MCCPSHLKGQQIKKLEREGIRRPIYSNSKEDMTPGYDKAFVLVSGGIRLHEEEDMGEYILGKSSSINQSIIYFNTLRLGAKKLVQNTKV